jgi:hypothetical protein
MTVHASDEAELHLEGRTQRTVEVVVTIVEKPESRGIADSVQDSAPTSPWTLEVARVGVRPVESSWRGRSAPSCAPPHRSSCLHARMCPLALVAASAWLMWEKTDWCQAKSDGENGQRWCEKQERATELLKAGVRRVRRRSFPYASPGSETFGASRTDCEALPLLADSMGHPERAGQRL